MQVTHSMIRYNVMLQYIKRYYPGSEDVLYVSLDDIWFSSNSLVELADQFVKYGGKRLFLDEVHKYPDWAREVKNVYDDHPGLQVVFTGSSMLEILNARADLRLPLSTSLHGIAS